MKILAVFHALLSLAGTVSGKVSRRIRNGTRKKAIMLYFELGIVTILIVTNGLLPCRSWPSCRRGLPGLRRWLKEASRAPAARWRWHPIPENSSPRCRSASR
jgi:hypothetical protein